MAPFKFDMEKEIEKLMEIAIKKSPENIIKKTAYYQCRFFVYKLNCNKV